MWPQRISQQHLVHLIKDLGNSQLILQKEDQNHKFKIRESIRIYYHLMQGLVQCHHHELKRMKYQLVKGQQKEFQNKQHTKHQYISECGHQFLKLESSQQPINLTQSPYFNALDSIINKPLPFLKLVLSLQRANQVYRDTIHSQEKLASECQKVLRWIEAIMGEAAVYRPHKLPQRKNNDANEQSEETGEGLASRLRNSNAFDPEQEEINEQTLKQIFKDFNLKNKIERLKHTLQETLVNTRKSHSQNVLKNNEFIYEDRQSNPSKSPNKQAGSVLQRKNSLLKRKSMRLTDKQKEDQTLYERINIRLDQEKLLIAEERLSVLVKKMININGKLFDDQVIPTQNDFMDISQSLRDGIDTLLVLGITPFSQSTYSLMDFQPDNYYVNEIRNSSDEWVKYVRERVGVQRMSRFDPFLKQDHQIFNNFDVQTLYSLINQAQSSNIKKKELTKLILNLRRVENRYETSFQLLAKQNELLQRIMAQMNLHVEKLVQFNKKQHHFYEKILMQDIYNPFLELTKLQKKIGGPESENQDQLNKKDLLSFYSKFQSLSQQFEGAFKHFILVEEMDVKLNNSILELMKIYEKNHLRFKDNVQDWKKLLISKFEEEQNQLKSQVSIIQPKGVKNEVIDDYEVEQINEGQLLLNTDGKNQ
ncbi:UNKNOWN [Stylonychia lemnae]|uniref:Uncharacterized protein n=1 Tax=Stylonychia lemnae TaxID=5949 RepID=A0A078A5T9_STYLE|nr:UNKNOWN [Stylonychia lemnae]|eukprot:CDW77271.1 UNKNOWN [Stylonychia lemnae]